MNTAYNPFSKDFDDVSTEDLSLLRSAAEGWYIEYKREVPNANSIVKSITAFANTYGGWVFYGVAEKSKEDAVAGEFPGVDITEADGALQRIRQAVANHAQPSPYFRAKALFGPVEGLELADGRAIVMIHVPWGPEAPYVHKDGRIYRRVGDGSEPKPENDRFVLDQLWKRSEKTTDKYADWTESELETSNGEENSAYVRLFIISDFWGNHDTLKSVPLRKVREIVSDVNGHYVIPFDNVYQTSGGYICRQVADNDPESLGLTWKLSRNFESEIIIPLAKFRTAHLVDLDQWLGKYDHYDRFYELCEKQRYERPTVLDLNMLLHILLGIARTLVTLADEFSWKGPLFVKIEISGIWRTIPFLDIPRVLDEYARHGMPLCLRDKLRLHPGKEKESYIELEQLQTKEGDERRVLIATQLFIRIAAVLGAFPSVDLDADGDGADFADLTKEFLDAGDRAFAVQKARTS